MIRTYDLFQQAKAGIETSSALLQTAGENIANVNTDGYVREQTSVGNGIVGSVGDLTTNRVLDQFAQEQLRTDMSKVGKWDIYNENAQTIDNLLASEANSLATGISDFFASVQSAADDPTDLASRNLLLSDSEGVLRRMTTMSDYLEDMEEYTNERFDSVVSEINELLQSISDLNEAVLFVNNNQEPTALLNERDKAIDELSEYLSINVRESSNDTYAVTVSLKSGDALVLEDGTFNIVSLAGDADNSARRMTLKTDFNENKFDTEIYVDEDNLGGTLGGLFEFRNDILGKTQRDLGQLAVSFTERVNEQNSFGMDLDYQLGGDIFTIPEFEGQNYDDNTAVEGMTGQISDGGGDVITDADIRVTVAAIDGTNQPTSLTVSLLDTSGDIRQDEDGNDLTTTVAYTPGAGYQDLGVGIDIDIDTGVTFAVDDAFLFQPLKTIAADITMATNRAEDIALASPIRVETELSNSGSAYVSGTSVSNTTVSATDEGSAFDGSQDIHDSTGSPSATLGAPVRIVFSSESDYELFDIDGNSVATVTGATSYENLIEQAKSDASWPADFSSPTRTDYPGYDLSLEGIPADGDTFNIVYNTNGVADNTNALAMAELQNAQSVQLSDNASTDPRTFHEAYSAMVSEVGEETAASEIALSAAEAMLEQSQTWFDSISGVSLDEEAANLVRFQQSYAASARVLSAAQEMFDTILAAAR